MCAFACRSERGWKKLNAGHNELHCIKDMRDLWAIITETLAYFHHPLTVRQRLQDRFNRRSPQLTFTALLCPLAAFLLFSPQLNPVKRIYANFSQHSLPLFFFWVRLSTKVFKILVALKGARVFISRPVKCTTVGPSLKLSAYCLILFPNIITVIECK